MCSTFSGYKSHIYREHKDLIDQNSSNQGIPANIHTHIDETLLSTSYDIQSNFDNQIHDEEDERNESENETNEEDVVCWPLLTEKIIRSSEKK